ncbi:diguanylate cyclase [Zoogloea sp. LCSB751]|uniref:diguanylate cyclase domain-containing protein n=1 Tax=Zoogloea sp. LCSB751 TaxID=1965277 RepID=UPI0009A4E067|nr:diguanylate cyclase [Zoogloea sp. LCSB751]
MGTALETLLHHLVRFILACLLALDFAGLAHSEDAQQVFRVGITSFRDKSVTLREWSPTMDYLAGKIPGSRFVAVPMNLHEFEAAISQHEIDFVITNPEHYILLETVHGVSRVATLVKRENGVLVNQFGGVIFTRADRHDIRDLADVKGKRIASVDRSSFAAFLLQYDLLKKHDVDVDRDCQVNFLGFPQDLSVRAVLDGHADVGFVRSSVLEAMAREGKIALAQIQVLHPTRAGDFPFLISTGLFPEWPFAAAPRVPIDIRNQVAAALLLMPPDTPAAHSARYYRWSTPVEYLSVQNLMRRHHIYPYDKVEAITLRELFQHHAVHIVAAALALILVMASLYLRARRLNAALTRSRQQLDHQAHYDALTGLPNRNLLDYDLERALSQARRTGQEFALCLMDLDGFKPINDRWGHKVGDEVLREVAQRLQDSLRAGDRVARWGGDEFVLLLGGVATHPQLAEIIERILHVVAMPLDSCSGAHVCASIGVSLYPRTAEDAEGLLKSADEAMYKAKHAGGNRFVAQA